MRLFASDVIRSLSHSWARTAFALLGIVMGIASLVFIVAAIEGSSSKANDAIRKMGSDSILLFAGGRPSALRKIPKVLTFDHVRDLSRLEGTFALAYGMINRFDVRGSSESMKTRVFGISPLWFDSWEYVIDEGVGFMPQEYEGFSKRVVIGHDLAQYLFGKQNPIGKTVVINNSSFTVCGLYERKGKNPAGDNLDQQVFMPLSIYQKLMDQEFKYVTVIRLRVSDISRYDETVSAVREILETTLKPDDFFLLTPTQIKKFLSTISSGLSLFLGLASATALLISGFVLSNIFAINTEVRRWEIGLRRALGATRRDILVRFLAEAVVIALIGASIGTVIGFAGVYFAMPLLDIPSVYPLKAFAVSAIFSVVVALIAALSPARKAANFEPLSALRAKV